MAERDADRAVSQTVRAQLALRDLILSGGLKPGERISELQAVETTGVSRTPVRMALVRLEEEGLLEAIPSGGFMVKAFSERDILDSIELRGTLEGLAARFAAERGVSVRDLEPLKECLNEIDGLVRQDPISVEAFSSYVALNARFHALLTELSRSPPLIRQIDRASALPFAEWLCDGAIGAAGGASDPADRAGPSSHRGRRHREPRGRARRSGHARTRAPCRTQSAAGVAQPHPSRFAACSGADQVGGRLGEAIHAVHRNLDSRHIDRDPRSHA
jgi:DNA-binding GntR family transcriptional regulator